MTSDEAVRYAESYVRRAQKKTGERFKLLGALENGIRNAAKRMIDSGIAVYQHDVALLVEAWLMSSGLHISQALWDTEEVPF